MATQDDKTTVKSNNKRGLVNGAPPRNTEDWHQNQEKQKVSPQTQFLIFKVARWRKAELLNRNIYSKNKLYKISPADKSMTTDPTELQETQSLRCRDRGFTQTWDTVGRASKSHAERA